MSEQRQARPFQVGDKVVSKEKGNGVVVGVDGHVVYPVDVIFEGMDFALSYTKDGRFDAEGETDEFGYDIQHSEPEPLMNELDDLLIQRQSDGQMLAAYCSGVFSDDYGTWFYEIKHDGVDYVCGSSLSFLDKDEQEYKVVEITQK